MEEKFIPLSVPNIKGNEIKYVTEALEAEWVSTGGAMINRFEQDIAEYVHAGGAAACQSGTAGIHMALRYLGVGAGDAVIVPALTFIAAVNPVRYEGAEPVFMDCDDSLCMDPVKLAEFFSAECEKKPDGAVYHTRTSKKIKAIVVVHIFGNMADMESITDIAAEYGVPLVEDATEALGTCYTEGRYKGRFAGTIGNIGVYSFNGNKIITTGGGGMVVSNDREALERIRYFSTQAKDDAANFIHNDIGYNYRMTNIQAAMGVAQLERLEEFIGIKKRNYLRYKAGLEGINGVELLGFRPDIRTNYWFYSVYLQNKTSKERQALIDGLAQRGIQSRPIWGLIPDQKPYAGSIEYRLEVCRKYYERVVNIPCSSNLSEADVDRVLGALKELLG